MMIKVIALRSYLTGNMSNMSKISLPFDALSPQQELLLLPTSIHHVNLSSESKTRHKSRDPKFGLFKSCHK